MDIALLNRKVTVQKNTVVVDDIGIISANGMISIRVMPPSAGSPQMRVPLPVTVVDNTKADFSVRCAKLCRRLLLTDTESCITVRYTTSLALTTRISRRNP